MLLTGEDLLPTSYDRHGLVPKTIKKHGILSPDSGVVDRTSCLLGLRQTTLSTLATAAKIKNKNNGRWKIRQS